MMLSALAMWKQAVDQILEDPGVFFEEPSDLVGVYLVSAGILAGEIEHPRDVLHFVRRDLKDFFEGLYFVGGDLAVGLRHFGAQGNDPDGKGDLLGGVTAQLVAPRPVSVVDMASQPADQRTNRPAHREPGGCPDDFAPNAHELAPLRT